MFGGMFSGLFGKGTPTSPTAVPGYGGGMIEPDALGQAVMGAPMAMGSGNPGGGSWLSGLFAKFNNMDPQTKALMMDKVGRGFSSGMGGFSAAQMPQMRNVYQPMTAAQQPVMFNPQGGRY